MTKKSVLSEKNVPLHIIDTEIHLQSSLFQGENLFDLWWLFFDEGYTTKLGMEINCLKFSAKLLSYLKTINSVLQDLTISYNGLNIVSQDFRFILDHLKHLKHLTIFAAFGTERNILEYISDSKCQLQSFKFGQTQNMIDQQEFDKNVILQFLKTQNKEITSLDMTHWTRYLHIDEKRDVFAYLQNCQKLKKLKIHFEDFEEYQSDLSHLGEKGSVLSDNLPKTHIIDLTIDFCDVAKVVYNQAWFSWLQDIPVDVKVRFKDLTVLYFDLNFDQPMPMGLFKQVVDMDNLKLISGSWNPSWIIDSDWKNLEKLTMDVSFLKDSGYDYLHIDPQASKWHISFPNLKEATLNVGKHHFLYSSFMAIILGSKRLENLHIYFKGQNSIRQFDEIDFDNQLKTVKNLNLKTLSLTCTNRRQPMPCNSLLSLVKTSPNLQQITFDLMPDQLQVFQELGFTIQNHRMY